MDWFVHDSALYNERVKEKTKNSYPSEKVESKLS